MKRTQMKNKTCKILSGSSRIDEEATETNQTAFKKPPPPNSVGSTPFRTQRHGRPARRTCKGTYCCPFGTLLEPSWGLLRPFWAVLWRIRSLCLTWGSLEGVLRPPCVLGCLWPSPTPSWRSLFYLALVLRACHVTGGIRKGPEKLQNSSGLPSRA